MKSKMRIKTLLKFITISFLLVPLIIVSLLLSSCCYDLGKISKSIEESLMDELSDEFLTDETISYEEIMDELSDELISYEKITYSDGSTERVIGKTSPYMEMNISQEGSDGTYFEKGRPVSFSAISLIDPDKDQLEFVWEIDDSEGLEGKEISYIFNEIGDYTIRLNGKGENYSDYVCKTIQICKTVGSIILLKEHKCSLKVEYSILNNGPGKLSGIQCNIETPKTWRPFQVISDCSEDSENAEEVEDDMGNLFYRYELGDLVDGESASGEINYNLVIYEFDDKSYDNIFTTFDADDEDIELYTGSGSYIDSDSPTIIEAVDEAIGSESNPYLIAEKLYSYITDNLDYDYELAADNDRQLFKASEILERGKGTCMDYSIVYAAVCRAAGIPAKYVSGVPIAVAVGMENQEIFEYHAWNEIKLPEYGWIPLDVTWESGFLTHNYCLNLKTHEGLEYDYFSFYYHTSGDGSEPGIITEYSYSVDGIDQSDLDWASFSEFIEIFK